MATFDDNIKTIQTAIYGKEMRPAISEALTKSWGSIKIMMDSVDKLNARIDALTGGGVVDPDNPDQPQVNIDGVVVGDVQQTIYAICNNKLVAGDITIL